MSIVTKVLLITLTIILMVPLTSQDVYSHYPHNPTDCPTTEKLGSDNPCLKEQKESLKDVKFVDIFFSDDIEVGDTNISKVEVEPGDGNVILTAVMANSGSFTLTGAKAWIHLPLGFKAVGKPEGEPATDSYDISIMPGDTFVFEFPVEITKNTRIGIYNATIHVEYFRATDISLNFRDFHVEFLLPGKSVLDAVATNSVLFPSTTNKVMIDIVNKGSAPASSVIVSVRDVNTNTQLVNVGSKIWNIGMIEQNSKAVIDPLLYVNPLLTNTHQILPVRISYTNSYGVRNTVDIDISFIVAGSATESIDFSISSDKLVIPTLTPVPLSITLSNTGTEVANSIEVTVSTPITATVALEQQVPQASKSPISIIGNDGYYRIPKIEPRKSANVTVTFFASEEAVNTAYQLPITISYLDSSGGLKTIQRFISLYVQGTINLRIYDLGITTIAGTPNLSGYLLNEGTNKALFTTIELLDSDLKPIGGSQYLGDLTANSPLPFSIPVEIEKGGTYNVAIKVSYKDDLRVPHEVIMNGVVEYTPLLVVQKESTDTAMFTNFIYMGIGAASIGLTAYYFAHKKKKNNRIEETEFDL